VPAGRVVAPSLDEILRSHETRITTEAERFLADPAAWIYVGSGAPAPDFLNGFSNVGGTLVPLRYRFLRAYDAELDPSTANPLAIQVQGSVTGGSLGLPICQLLYPQTMPDGTPAWVPAIRDFDVHLTCTDDDSNLVIVTIQGATANLVYGFV
jgi:hypothetical protein